MNDSDNTNLAVQKPAPSFRSALAGLALSMLLSSLGTSIASVSLPAVSVQFEADFQTVQWVVLAYLLVITVLIVSIGQLGDRIGPRRLLLTGIAIFTGASILCGMAPSLAILIAARAVQGLGAAAMMALSVAFVRETVPTEKTGSAMGLLGTMSALGTALGPPLGGLLIAIAGWHAVFLVNIPLGIAAALLVYRFVPADRRAAKKSFAFDRAGTAALILALTGYAMALTMGHRGFGSLNAALMLTAIMAAGVFAFVESRSSAPLIGPEIFRDPSLSSGLAMSVLVATVLMGTLVVGPFYLSRALDLNVGTVGLIMATGPMIVAFSGVPIGHVVDRFGEHPITLGGLAAITAGTISLSVIPISWGAVGYLVPTVFITVGYAMFQTANNTAVMRNVDHGRRGAVSGMLSLSRNLGLITGTSAMGAIFTFAAGTRDLNTAPPDAVGSGMRAAFAAGTVVISIALTIALARRLVRAPLAQNACS